MAAPACSPSPPLGGGEGRGEVGVFRAALYAKWGTEFQPDSAPSERIVRQRIMPPLDAVVLHSPPALDRRMAQA